MTTARPYREAHAPEEAFALLATNMAFRFDPALVAVFEKALA